VLLLYLLKGLFLCTQFITETRHITPHRHHCHLFVQKLVLKPSQGRLSDPPVLLLDVLLHALVSLMAV
jgi:hypothetical protein